MPITLHSTRLLQATTLAFVLCTSILLTPVSPATAAEDKARTITLTGTGSVTARPDIVHISTGVASDAKTAGAALSANTASMSKVISQLKAQGLEAKDIQTTDFSVQPRYRHYKDGQPATIIGYRVVNSVRITVRDISKLGAILDKVVTLGSNQIGGIRFSVSNAEKLKDTARRNAMADAIRKAEIYAAAAGVKLGQVKNISESFTSRPPRPVFARAAMRAEAASVPIEAGEQSLEVRVNVSWELD